MIDCHKVKKMHDLRRTFIVSLITLSILSILPGMLVHGVTADGVLPPAQGSSYRWNVLSANGDVYWYNNAWDYEGLHALKVNGTISFNLTGQYKDDNAYSPLTNTVWYGNFSISHPVGATQVENWTKANCSTTEIGMNLALSALSWCGGLVAPLNWTENRALILAQPADNVSYQVMGNQAFIHYEYNSQITFLIYDISTGVLIYAKAAMFGYWLEVFLADYVPVPTVPGSEPGVIMLVLSLATAFIVTKMTKSAKKP
jgi:hypothetical protein